MTDFVNLKIKLAQSFEYAHRDRMCMIMFIGVSTRTCMSICVCTVFFFKNSLVDIYKACMPNRSKNL
jgi:hypothetical protein